MMMIQSNTTNETEGTVEVFNYAQDSEDEEMDIDMDDGSIEAAAAPSFFKKFRSFCGGKFLTIGGIVLAVAIAFATGFASGSGAKQAELVQMKAEASYSDPTYGSKESKTKVSKTKVSKTKSSKVYKTKSSKMTKAPNDTPPPPVPYCADMVGVHLGDSYHNITCDIDAVTTCAPYSPPDACCFTATMDWGVTTDMEVAGMLLNYITGNSAVIALQGSLVNGTTIAGAVTFPDGIMMGLVPETGYYTVASTSADNTYEVFAYGALDVTCNK